MHILFVHRNYPAQFGHLAARLVSARGHRCTFVSETPAGVVSGVEKIQYKVTGGASDRSHYTSRSFENAVWHAAGVYEALKPLAQTAAPDLIVGHSGFGSTLFLADLFPGVPILNYFEFFYHARGSDLDFRPEFPPLEYDRLRSRARNAMILLDLHACRQGYTPTHFQHALFPPEYQPKIRVLHDGIDTDFWSPQPPAPAVFASLNLPPGVRLVTYVSRGLESLRGFDIFMQVARRIYQQRSDVLFLVIGSDRVAYGGDLKRIAAPTFKEHVLQTGDYDLRFFRFLGQVPPATLAALFNLSDLHIYLTAPFVLSWSVLNAMACQCPVLASATAPVLEVIDGEQNGLLANFFDIDALAAQALRVLADPPAFRRTLGAAARQTVLERYSLEHTFPLIAEFFESTAQAAQPGV